MKNKYYAKAKEIENYCKKERAKYKLIGITFLIIVIIISIVLIKTKNYKSIGFLTILILPETIYGIIIGKIKRITKYENEQIKTIQRLELENELKD